MTGLFDIGREHWASYSRKKSAYLHDARVVLGLPNRMVIFTSPDLVDHFVAERRRRGLMDRTVVFGMSVYCIPYAWLLEGGGAGGAGGPGAGGGDGDDDDDDEGGGASARPLTLASIRDSMRVNLAWQPQ